MARALVGTSGWIYPHWNRVFYPPKVKRRLAFLAERFPTVEINATFYRLQRPSCFERWRGEVPPDFVFAVKASRYVTHLLKLKGGAEPLGNFFAQGTLVLGRQLGPILWQLPRALGFDRARVRAFLEALPRDVREAEALARRHDARVPEAVVRAPDGRDRPLRHAFEARHPSWLCDEAYELFIHHGVDLVTADSAGRFPFSLLRTTSEFAYLRLHGARRLYGSDYTAEELDWWARLVRGYVDDGLDVYVYFDNDNKAYAPQNALELLRRLGRQPEEARPAL